MKQVLALGMVAVALAVGARAAGNTNPNSITLAVYGDSPYLDPAFPNLPAAEFSATPAFVNTINIDPSIQEVVHVGDIHSGSEACTVAYDQAIFNFWTAFQKPLIYTPVHDNAVEVRHVVIRMLEPGVLGARTRLRLDVPPGVAEADHRPAGGVAERLDADLVGSV